jgi:hypothetical protein
VHRKEHGNAAVGVVLPREVHPKRHYREGGSEAKNHLHTQKNRKPSKIEERSKITLE